MTKRKPLSETVQERGGGSIVTLTAAIILRDLDVEADLATLRARLFDLPEIADMDDAAFAEAVNFLRRENKAGRL